MSVLGDATWGAALVAFVGGVVSFFSPCVAPLVPGYIGYLSGGYLSGPAVNTTATATQPPTDSSGERAWARALPVCLLFVAGFSVALVGVGLLMATAGRLLAAY
ncbi:MAG: cytochrome c biogenesis protein CcdA, partial [Ktedonobacterales bacterium]